MVIPSFYHLKYVFAWLSPALLWSAFVYALSFYINGEAGKATNELMTTVGNNGKGNNGAGTIDELIIFQRELTAKEIKHLIEDGGTEFLSVEPRDKLPVI